jgi:hypothetical protein
MRFLQGLEHLRRHWPCAYRITAQRVLGYRSGLGQTKKCEVKGFIYASGSHPQGGFKLTQPPVVAVHHHPRQDTRAS